MEVLPSLALHSQTPANSGTLGFYDKNYVDFAGFEVSNGWLASCHKGSPEYGEPWKPYSAPRSACAAIDMPLGLYQRTPTKPIINLEIVYDCALPAFICGGACGLAAAREKRGLG